MKTSKNGHKRQINPTPQRGEPTVPSLTQGEEEKREGGRGGGGEDNLAFV